MGYAQDQGVGISTTEANEISFRVKGKKEIFPLILTPPPQQSLQQKGPSADQACTCH